MAEDCPPCYEEGGEEWTTTGEESQSDQALLTVPTATSGAPASSFRDLSRVNNVDFLQCSPTYNKGPRQDPDTTSAYAGAGQEESVYSTSAQNPAISASAATFTPPPTSAAPTTTASNLPGFDFANSALAIVKSVGNSMAPFSKRAYRQAHQTIEFFEQQPTPTQRPSDARPTSTMTSAGNNSHRATMQGTIQKCPGPEKCADCKAGRTAPTQAGGSSALPAGALPSVSKSGEMSQQHTTIHLSDIHYGITHATRASVQAEAKFESINPPPRRSTLSWGEMFCCLTEPFRRQAAKDTILHLVQKIEQDKVEKGCIADYLPFLADCQIIQMIEKAKLSSEWLSKPDEVDASRKLQASSTRAVPTPAPADPKSSDPAGKTASKTASAHDKDISQEIDSLILEEEQNNLKRLKIWGDILMRENRKMRNKWISETEAKLDREQHEGATESKSTESLKALLEAVKAGDEESPTGTLSQDDVSIAMNLAVKTAIPSDPTIPYSQKYNEILADPGFQPIAKSTLIAWCSQNNIPGWSRETGRLYQRLIRAGDDLPKDVWTSSSPPVWNEKEVKWLWPEEKEKDAATTAPLTKNQKRAKARKEARKAKREEPEADEVAVAPNPPITDNNNFSLDLTAPLPSTPYPPPPSPPHTHATVIPWALSLSASQLASLTGKDRVLGLRAHYASARRFLLSAARLLTPDMFERLVDPAADVLNAMDLPPARYRFVRCVVLGTSAAGQAAGKKYEEVEKMVRWARDQQVQAPGLGDEVQAAMKPAEILAMVEEGKGGEEERVETRAEAVLRFLARWPRLEGVVMGAQRKYRPEIA